MIHSEITLSGLCPDAVLVSYIHDHSAELAITRRCVIICPGGGYMFLSDREAEPVALQYFAAGFNVFILKYSVKEKAVDFAPIIQAALAVRHIRESSEKYHIDPDYIFVAGFSAGGHLAAACGTLWNTPEVKKALTGAPAGIGKPTGVILCYPVITAGEFTHAGSINALCGNDHPSQEERERFSLEKYVSSETAPAFIWHTFDDATVPVQNSLLYSSALAQNGVPFELHIFPHGCHGLSLCNKETWAGMPGLLCPAAECWMELSVRWMRDFV